MKCRGFLHSIVAPHLTTAISIERVTNVQTDLYDLLVKDKRQIWDIRKNRLV